MARIALVLMVLLCGCSSVQMKGTPFYTGEYETRRGPAEERINDWPLVGACEEGQDNYSFLLWRFFRYERDETTKKLDLLFLPLMRKQAHKTAAGSTNDDEESRRS